MSAKENKKGKLIVVYGPNNEAKKIFIDELFNRLKVLHPTQRLTIKIDNSSPDHQNPNVNFVSRPGEHLKVTSPSYLNCGPSLEQAFNRGINILSESYSDQSIAEEMAEGQEDNFPELQRRHRVIREPDLTIVLTEAGPDKVSTKLDEIRRIKGRQWKPVPEGCQAVSDAMRQINKALTTQDPHCL